MASKVTVMARGGGGDPLIGKYPSAGGTLRASSARGIVNWPQLCVCCGQATSSTTKMGASKSEYSAWTSTSRSVGTYFDVPCCANCTKHWNIYAVWSNRIMAFLALPMFLVLAAAYLWGYESVDKSHGDGRAVLLGIFLVVVALIILSVLVSQFSKLITNSLSKRFYNSSCSTKGHPAQCVNIRPASNTYTFEFENEAYAKVFKEANN